MTVEAGQADEFVELYESLGDEVRVESLTTARMAMAECATCLLAACEQYAVVFARPKE